MTTTENPATEIAQDSASGPTASTPAASTPAPVDLLDATTVAARSTVLDGFRVLGVAIRREPWVFALSTAGSVLFGALTVADAWVLGWSTDNVLLPAFRDGEIGTSMLVAVVALFVGVALLRAVGIVARRLGAGIMQYRMQAASRREVTAHYLRLPMAWHQRHPTGQLLSVANSDVEAAWSPIAPLPMAVGTVAMMVIAVAQMLLVDLPTAAVGLLVFPAVTAVTLIYQRISSPLYTEIQQRRAELSDIAHESFDGAMVVKTLGREDEETARFAATAEQLRDLGIRAGRLRAIFDPLLEAIPNIGVLAVLAVGVARVRSGAADAGDIVTLAYLLTIVSFPIRSIGWLLGEFPRSVVGYRRIQAVLAEPLPEETGSVRQIVRPGDVHGARLEVSDLRFRYDGGQPVLDDVSFTVEPGRTVAIVGETASGKSTLTTLLTHLVDPEAGVVALDGVPLGDLAPGELARQVVLVSQTAFLFDDTVRDNVTLGAPIPDEEVWAALELAQAAGFVRALPQGLDSPLGERGTTLSGGQRQRLALARAVVRQPRLMILDDATSAVDPEVEARILGGVRQMSGEATLLLIAYREATIGLADEVVFLHQGRVADRGTHAELVARNPAYARLVTAYRRDAAAGGEG